MRALTTGYPCATVIVMTTGKLTCVDHGRRGCTACLVKHVEREAMKRVVTYLLTRAGGLNRAADKCEVGSEAGETARIKALGLIEAATKITEGIDREEIPS